ncbi:ATP-dependent Clp protease ATP-binding subunit [Candidatus Nomurabacteria bacterium]|nr:ATP-dependent Clp protease ATP-binding subunit [Candidatus Nomurabacteria bacterium]
MRRILNEAVGAGNVILVLENFASFIESAHTIGTDIVDLLSYYLTSAGIQIVALTDSNGFHQSIETNKELSQFFEKVLVKETDATSVINLVETEALRFEAEEDIFFTYPAIATIVESADRYFSDGSISDKAMDLILEITPRILKSKKYEVTRDDVLDLVQSKTKIPQGVISPEEKEKLLNLESLLHKRIIGQDEAVVAISNAMRRSRSGVGSKTRPMGSFLFFGPTGVGKTETTKALASTFFGDEKNIVRLDMSEYKTEDSMERLIGSFKSGKQGVLSTALREKPYGVLLLDEFEKANHEILDLFLQILDEGFFSDMTGKRVNVRNMIIIATSNAGSDLIFDYLKKRDSLMSKKDEIIQQIIARGIFKPELINRFDDAVLFQPLGKDQLKLVAKIMLQKLQSRLNERGYIFTINDELVNLLVEQGMDPAFGARPMNRAIQDILEKKIAEKIIRGELKTGKEFTLTKEDLK